MAKWIKSTERDEQIQMLEKSQTIVRVRYNSGIEINWNIPCAKYSLTPFED